jgi:L,D-peptidoglycan transpeptidase YkuD (ErfK/YbiS/YcfS/YnhG family)
MRRVLATFTVAALGVFAVGVLQLVGSLPVAAAVPVTPGQVITVQAATASSTTAQLTLWKLNSYGIYVNIWGPATAYVGELGVGATRDNVARTPAGVFNLTQAFGNRPNNGTKLPYFQANRADWWNGEDNSPAYNTHVHQAASPGPGSENLYDAGFVYSHAVVINYNMHPVVKGAGSAFFLHVSNGQPTAGCVSIGSAHLDDIMRWLDPAQHPVISIGVGAQAMVPIMRSHNPRGYIDTARQVAAGKVQVTGWAMDPDNRAAVVRVEMFLDNRRVTIVSTGVPRPDVAKARAAGPNQGYSYVFTVTKGTHTFCTAADNIGLGNSNPKLGCLTTTVK